MLNLLPALAMLALSLYDAFYLKDFLQSTANFATFLGLLGLHASVNELYGKDLLGESK